MSFTAIAVFALYSTVRLLNAYAPEAPFWLAFVIAGAIGFGLGMINAFFIARFNLPTLIVTLGTMSMFHGFLLFAIGNTIVRDLPPSLTAFSRATLVQVQMERGVANLHPAIFFTAVIAVLVWLLMDFTMLGRGVYALGGARDAAERAGFNIRRIQYFIYGLVGLLSGFGGMIYGSLNRQANPQDIVGSELNVIAAVVLGGASDRRAQNGDRVVAGRGAGGDRQQQPDLNRRAIGVAARRHRLDHPGRHRGSGDPGTARRRTGGSPRPNPTATGGACRIERRPNSQVYHCGGRVHGTDSC